MHSMCLWLVRVHALFLQKPTMGGSFYLNSDKKSHSHWSHSCHSSLASLQSPVLSQTRFKSTHMLGYPTHGTCQGWHSAAMEYIIQYTVPTSRSWEFTVQSRCICRQNETSGVDIMSRFLAGNYCIVTCRTVQFIADVLAVGLSIAHQLLPNALQTIITSKVIALRTVWKKSVL